MPRKPLTSCPTVEQLEPRDVPSGLGGLFGGGNPGIGPIGYSPPIVPFVRGLAVGYLSGTEARVRVYQTTTQFQDFKAFDDPNGYPIRVATGDLNGDGVPDVIATLGAGPPFVDPSIGILDYTGGESVQIFDGTTLGQSAPRVIANINTASLLVSGYFIGSVGFDVAAADFEGDGKADLVMATASGVSTVFVFSGADIARLGSDARPVASFSGIADPNFTGGTTVATGDVNGDGVPDLVVGAGPGGGPRVAVFDGTSLRSGQTARKLFNDFFAFNSSLRTGINVAVMDVNRDGRGDVLAGVALGGPEMVAIDGAALLASNGGTVSKFFDENLGDGSSSGGIEMVVKDFDGDGVPDLAVSHKDRGLVTVYRGRYFYPSGGYVFPGQFAAVQPGTVDGVWVG
jgi:hypothetical protein